MYQLGVTFAETRCLKRSNEEVAKAFEVFPVSLTSSKISRSVYEKVLKLNEIQNRIWTKIVADPEFLLECCKELELDDDFVAHFTGILRKV